MDRQKTLELINHFFDLMLKIERSGDKDKYERNFNRIFDTFTEEGFRVHNPQGEAYNETRTDYEATFTSDTPGHIIQEVVKPTIYFQSPSGQIELLQKAIVLL